MNTLRILFPWLLLPFLAGINYLVLDMRAPVPTEPVSTKGLITELPDPLLEDDAVSGKFEAFRQTYKQEGEGTVITTLDSLVPLDTAVNEDRNDARQLDSVKNVWLTRTRINARNTEQQVREQEPKSEWLKQPSEKIASDSLKPARIDSIKPAKPEPVRFYGLTRQSGDPTSMPIKGILVQDLHVSEGVRIPIQLLGEHQSLVSGSTVYGMITSLAAERVQIHVITSEGKSYTVYDLDGQAGLYVPQAGFVEVSKQLGESMAGLEIPVKVTTSFRSKLTTPFRSKVTTLFRSKVTT